MVAQADTQNATELFPIIDGDELGNLWHQSGAISFAWFAHPVACEHLSGKARHDKAEILGKAMGNLPAGSTCQFIYRNNRYVDWAITNFLQAGNSTHRWLRQYELSKARAFREWSGSLKLLVGADVNVKDCQVMVVITIFEAQESNLEQSVIDVIDAIGSVKATSLGLPANKAGNFLQRLKETRAHRRSQRQAQLLMHAMSLHRTSFEKAFEAIGMAAIPASLPNFVRFCRGLVDPLHGSTDALLVDRDRLIPEMVFQYRVEFVEEGRFVRCNGAYQAMLTLDAYPERPYAGIFSLNHPDIAGNLSLLDFLGDGVLAVNCKVVDERKAVVWLDSREQQTKGKGNEGVTSDKAYREVTELLDWVQNLNRSLLDVSISIKVVGSRPDEASNRASDLRALAQSLQIGLRVEDTDAKTHWCEQFPGGFNTTMEDGALRVRRKRDVVVGAFAPIYGSGRGNRTGTHLLCNEHYEPYFFNQWESRAYNVFVCGESGAGKSNKMVSIIRDHLRADTAKAFIIDYGDSFMPLVIMADEAGIQVPLSMTRQSPHNPFAGPASDTIPTLLWWIPSLKLNSGEVLSSQVRAQLEEALRRAYRRYLKPKQPYLEYDEIPRRYPGLFPSNARKRFLIRSPSDAVRDSLVEQTKGSIETAPRYTVFVQIRLQSYKAPRVSARPLRSRADLDLKEVVRFENLYDYLEEDEQGLCLLVRTAEVVDDLTRRGYTVTVEHRYAVVEAQRIEDFRAVLRTGAEVIVPASWQAQRMDSLRKAIAARWGADHPEFPFHLAQAMQAPEAEQYFQSIEGLVDLQEEIVFSQFIDEAKTLNHPELNDLIAGLSQWYGEGIYADTFDRRGGPNLADYRVVYWDLKEVMTKGEPRYAAALLGTIMLRIQVYCNSVLTLRERKMVVMDEFHQIKTVDPVLVVRFIDTTTLQARKNNYCMLLGSQKIDHVLDSGVAGIDLLDQFQHYFIGAQTTRSWGLAQAKMGFSDEQLYVASQATMVPGKYSQFLLYVPGKGIFDLVREIQTPFELWLTTTHPDERNLRFDMYQKFTQQGKRSAESMILACLELAKTYPRGYQAANLIEIQ